MRGPRCVSEGEPADREEERSVGGKAEKGRGRAVFSVCSITVFVRTVVAPDEKAL